MYRHRRQPLTLQGQTYPPLPRGRSYGRAQPRIWTPCLRDHKNYYDPDDDGANAGQAAQLAPPPPPPPPPAPQYPDDMGLDEANEQGCADHLRRGTQHCDLHPDAGTDEPVMCIICPDEQQNEPVVTPKPAKVQRGNRRVTRATCRMDEPQPSVSSKVKEISTIDEPQPSVSSKVKEISTIVEPGVSGK